MGHPCFAGAIAYYRDKLKQNPTNPAHHHNLAPLLMAQEGNVRAAMYHYRRAFQLNPKDINSKNDLAAILWRMGKWEAALAALCQVLNANRDHYEANVNLAAVYFSKGEYDMALKHGRKATQLRPRGPLGHRVLGQILDQMGNSTTSLHHRKIAARRGPGAANESIGSSVSNPYDTRLYKIISAQLIIRGEAERENSYAYMDCYRAMMGRRVELANSERTREILQKCLR
ncbi:unnamed protein product [Hapterophycus canaliculatus]